ncbi:glycosyltransferase [Anaerovibrio lipolyticus]|uniref:glycosyltransferase n=1 Tax=Anaerovibrio lipolyticus TaxID=82374 RepID=UPI0009DFFB00
MIPVYNTKPYLTRCLQSVADQTYDNLEIICIDDGSTDGSEQIVDEFASKDARFVVRHQKNGGESNARNAGLDLLTGDYVTFVDCDDWLEPKMYEILVEALEKNGVDMSACGYSKDTNEKIEPAVNIDLVKTGIWNQHDLMLYVYKRDSYRAVTGYIWCKLYKKEILQDAAKQWIRFNEDIVLGGDILYFAEAALNTKKAIYVDKTLYHYIQRGSSGFHSQDESKWKDMILTYQMLLSRLEQAGISEDILIWIKRFLVYRGEVVAELAFKNNNSEILKMSQNVMQQYKLEYFATNQDYPERIELFNRIINYRL